MLLLPLLHLRMRMRMRMRLVLAGRAPVRLPTHHGAAPASRYFFPASASRRTVRCPTGCPCVPQVVDYSSQDVAEVYKEAPFDIAVDCMGTRSEWPRGWAGR